MGFNTCWSWLCSLITFLLLLNDSVIAHPRKADGFGQFARDSTDNDKYLIGVGKADITGPAADVVLTGYANLDQVGGGIRQRLHSRAFIIGDVKNPKDRFVYVVLDNLVGDTAVRFGVLEALAAAGQEYSVYGQDNIALAAVHSHSSPGGWNNYLVPQIPGYGFNDQSYQAIVDGAVLSIKRAHESLTEVSFSSKQFEY